MKLSSVDRIDRVDGHAIVRVRGDVDLVTAPDLAGKLWRLIADGDPLIEVDLADTTFMSARGIAVLVAARQLAALRGQVVRVVQPSPPARRVFDLGGVTRLLIWDAPLSMGMGEAPVAGLRWAPRLRRLGGGPRSVSFDARSV